jgi:ABC-type multidrug transport system fused ATPase/permease subunit
MSVAGDIMRSYPDPGGVVRRLLDDGRREDRALAMLMGGAAASFLAQIPPAIRRADGVEAVPLDGRIAGALFATLFVLPLLAFAVAAASRLAARVLGGQGTGYGARLALFWALLAVAPLVLAQGLVGGIPALDPIAPAAGVLVFLAFLWIWMAGLKASEFPGTRA